MEKDYKTDYDTFIKMYARLNEIVDNKSEKLKNIIGNNKGLMGLTDPKIKNSTEYKKAKADYHKVFNLTKNFLKGVPKDFMKKRAQAHKHLRR